MSSLRRVRRIVRGPEGSDWSRLGRLAVWGGDGRVRAGTEGRHGGGVDCAITRTGTSCARIPKPTPRVRGGAARGAGLAGAMVELLQGESARRGSHQAVVEAAPAPTLAVAPGPAVARARLVREPAVELVHVRDPESLRDRAVVEVVVFDDVQSNSFSIETLLGPSERARRGPPRRVSGPWEGPVLPCRLYGHPLGAVPTGTARRRMPTLKHGDCCVATCKRKKLAAGEARCGSAGSGCGAQGGAPRRPTRFAFVSRRPVNRASPPHDPESAPWLPHLCGMSCGVGVARKSVGQEWRQGSSKGVGPVGWRLWLE